MGSSDLPVVSRYVGAVKREACRRLSFTGKIRLPVRVLMPKVEFHWQNKTSCSCSMVILGLDETAVL